MKKVIILFTVLFSVCNVKAQEAVDLGLIVKWANMDLGATSPLEKGKKYAWGETDTKRGHLDYNSETKVKQRSKYGDIDICGTTRDAAREAWGGTWRMPNIYEVQQLFSSCKRETTYINDKKYFKFTGPNGNSILFPVMYYADNGNDYWSSCSVPHEEGVAISFGMSVYESTYDDISVGQDNKGRSIKLAIRPVMDYAKGEKSLFKENLLTKIKQQAKHRDLDDLYDIGLGYYMGIRATKDKELAYNIWEILAAEGHELSQQMVSKRSAKGGEVKKKNTLEDYAEQAVKGDKTAQEYILNHQNEIQQSQEALKIIAMAYVPSKCDFSKGWDNYCCYTAALMGNDKACVELADNGMMDSDLDTAIGLYEFAAKANNLDAMHRLGKIYLDQKLGRRDLEKGIYWYTKAADGGHSQAKKELGTFYKYGLNVKKNQKLAKQYLGRDYDD